MNERDPFLDALGEQWKRQPDPELPTPEEVHKLLRKNRLAWLGEVLGAFIALAAALYFQKQEDYLIYQVSALVMLLTAVTILVSSFVLRRPVVQWADWSVSGLLQYRIVECRTSIRNARAGIGSCLFLLFFVALFWLIEAWQGNPMPLAAKAMSTGVIAGGALLGLWMGRRRLGELKAELKRLEGLQKEYREDSSHG